MLANGIRYACSSLLRPNGLTRRNSGAQSHRPNPRRRVWRLGCRRHVNEGVSISLAEADPCLWGDRL